MKVASLLAQYLYIHKRLDLPKLGVFRLDPSVVIEPESNKQSKPTQLEGVSFESDPATKETPELIQFISSHTGKIKALASADLESHLELALQFLNIGKPFLFEGIGSLSRIRAGQYEFSPSLMVPAAIKELPVRDTTVSSRIEEQSSDYKMVLYPDKPKAAWKKPVAVLLLLAGLGLALWGGYTVYKRTTSKKDKSPGPVAGETELVTDTSKYQTQKPSPDTATTAPTTSPANVPAPVATPAGNYKFVLEVSPAKRALARYSRLKTFQWNVNLETKDSAAFKIYMMLPASPADTTRLIDSLSRLNGKRVVIGE